MSVANAAKSFVSILCMIIGVIFLVVAAVDLLENFGLMYCLILTLVGVAFLAISGRI